MSTTTRTHALYAATQSLLRARCCVVVTALAACTDPAPSSTPTPTPDAAIDAPTDRAPVDVAPVDAAPACPLLDAPGTYALTTERITAAGLDRTYTLAAPTAPCGSLALVLVFHGDGGAAGRTQRFLHLEDTTLGRAVVVYPDGLPIAGSPTGSASTWDLSTPTDRNRDVALFDAIVTAMQTRFRIDPRRIFATGLSRGAYFSNHLGCVRGDVLRAIAPNSGGGPSTPTGVDAGTVSYEGATLTTCPTPAVSAMVIHGDNDTVVAPAEGERSRLHWEHFNGCANTRAPEGPSPCEASQQCRDGRRVLWCLVPDLGHLYWPAFRESVWGFFDAMR